MADQFIAIDEPAVTDKKLDTTELTVGANTVQRERVNITGAAAADIAPVSATDGLLVNLGANNDVTVAGVATAAKQDTIIGHLDGVEGLLTTIDEDTAIISDRTNLISTAVGAPGVPNIAAVCVQGTSDPAAPVFIADGGNSITVDATNLDIRDLTNADVVTAELSATDNAVLDAIAASLALLDNAVGGNELQVDVLTLPNVTLAAGTNTNEVVGDVAHDAAAAGNPVGVGGVSQDMDDTAPPNRVSAEGDATRVATDRDGAQFVHPHGPQIWSKHLDGSSAYTGEVIHAAPGAGLSLYVTDIVFSSGAATAINLFFEEGASKVLGPYYLEAVAGRGIHIKFQTPKKITANTALTATTSAAIAQSIDVTGFTAQG